MKLLRVAAFFAVVLAGGVAAADRTDSHPCRFDIQRFCYGVERGGGQVARCLLKHHDELTPACRKDVDDRRHERR